ncbi:MAG: hypothetical protein A2149_06630 [Candidatus Schekmanbacteria bacterium RBG_16_38_11]|uniref:Metallo-beta-lactamase domain-containing protein n=1 Tax=Candidatus Schekmanbacteria bacterium RBG_16_38_11 TaxID=1817880 RepID=A0A1F7RYY8_9BACT|nr:MAG: hypothetical protein A2149_06630 [Candidatus Schekmanbacteria bacterium RBG_16_38_11]
MKKDFIIKFWGVRGSIATPGKSTIKYGGNTPCIEVRCGKEVYIFDAGSGLRLLGRKLIKEKFENINFLFSHFHWDHIQGFPFFFPAYSKKFTITMYGESKLSYSFEQLFTGQVMFPYFPVSLGEMGAKINFVEIKRDDLIDNGNVKIKIARLNHPGGCVGYRLEYQGKSFVYATDTEHFNCIDPSLLKIAKDTDVIVYDCNFTDEEYSGANGFPHTGWGHSTWTQGIKLAKEANVKKFIIFHHDPDHDDDFIEDLERKAKKEFKESYAAFEGMKIVL